MFCSYGGYELNEQTDHSVVEVPLKTLESFLKGQTIVDLQWCGTGEKERSKRDAEVVRSRERDLFVMTPTSENCDLSLATVMSVLSCVLLQGAQALGVGDFNHAECCKDSLYMGTPPRGYLSNSFKKICQRYENKASYVTLYDPHKHIPICLYVQEVRWGEEGGLPLDV